MRTFGGFTQLNCNVKEIAALRGYVDEFFSKVLSSPRLWRLDARDLQHTGYPFILRSSSGLKEYPFPHI